MSRIGKFETTYSLDSVLVDGPLGDPVHLFEEEDLEVEIESVVHCDRDGEIEAEILSATLLGLELTEEAIEALDLASHAAVTFCDSGIVPPKWGSIWRDSAEVDWEVMGTGRKRDQADGCMVLLKRLGHYSYALCAGLWEGQPTGLLVSSYDLVCGHQEPFDWREVLFEDELAEGKWRNPRAVYVGARKAKGEPS